MKVLSYNKTNLMLNPKVQSLLPVGSTPEYVGLRSLYQEGTSVSGFGGSDSDPDGKYIFQRKGSSGTSFAMNLTAAAANSSTVADSITMLHCNPGDIFSITILGKTTNAPAGATLTRTVIRYTWRTLQGATVGGGYTDAQSLSYSTSYEELTRELAPAPVGAHFIAFQFENRFGTNAAVGDEIRIKGITITRNEVNTTYFDGDTEGYSWLGLANQSRSVSNVKSAKDAVTMLNGLYNKILNPNFAGSGETASGWSPYTSGTTIAGTRSFGDNKLTLTATSLVGGNRRFGVAVAGASVQSNVSVRIKKDEILYARVKVDTTNLHPDTGVFLYMETREADWSTVIAYVTNNTISTDGYITIRWTAPREVYFNPWFIIGINRPGGIDFTGTTTAVVSEAIWAHLKAGEPNPDWFSGDTAGCKWEGVPNDSMSVSPAVRSTTVMTMTTEGLKET